jgi:putative effector of murein hydrolase LrgA (UPF0299 family)
MKQVEVMSQMKGIGDFLIALLVMAFVPAVVRRFFLEVDFRI